jgi:hypothetical protein
MHQRVQKLHDELGWLLALVDRDPGEAARTRGTQEIQGGLYRRPTVLLKSVTQPQDRRVNSMPALLVEFPPRDESERFVDVPTKVVRECDVPPSPGARSAG